MNLDKDPGKDYQSEGHSLRRLFSWPRESLPQLPGRFDPHANSPLTFWARAMPAMPFMPLLKFPIFCKIYWGRGCCRRPFIPVYANLLARGEEKEAGKVACAIFGLLAFFVVELLCLWASPELLT